MDPSISRHLLEVNPERCTAEDFLERIIVVQHSSRERPMHEVVALAAEMQTSVAVRELLW